MRARDYTDNTPIVLDGETWQEYTERKANPGAVVNGEYWGWQRIRLFVWERDKGVCQVCKQPIPYGVYECGHIVDRMNTGSDHPDNLVVMCVACNRLKPPTKTRQEYDEWVNSGFWVAEMWNKFPDLRKAFEEYQAWEQEYYLSEQGAAHED